MRRWNGWGDDTIDYPLTNEAVTFLHDAIGRGDPYPSADLADVTAQIPASRLAPHANLTFDPFERLRHARGQSLPDWIALRSGQLDAFPDAVAFPESASDIEELIIFASSVGAALIPYGGGTSVVGHINPPRGDQPAITVNMRRLNRLQTLNELDQLATFGAGVSGPELEAQLRAHDFTLGHYPQSFEYSTLGGWIATRSAGQQALLYGRIEALYAGGTVVTPAGTLYLPPFPASAAGPDLRQVVLGSEGRIGFITDATVRVSRLATSEQFHGLFFPDFSAGQAAVREIVQSQLPLSMLRLSTAAETKTTLALAGHQRLITMMGAFLKLRGVDEERTLLVAGYSGDERVVDAAQRSAQDIANRHGGVNLGQTIGKQWRKSRFRTPYLRNTLWKMGYAVDTLETAVPWEGVDRCMRAIAVALEGALRDEGERVHQFAHISHLYSSGASVYVTYIFRIAADPLVTLARWRKLKSAASTAIIAHEGTISHQHGIGLDHRPYLRIEKGLLGMELLANTLRQADPQGLMNPGKLITKEQSGAGSGARSVA
jgi:alkyldihydroxyacetonephosphate synthase